MQQKAVGIVMLLLLAGATGCSQAAVGSTAPPESISFSMPEGISAEALPYTFNQPTQFFVDDDNQLWVAQLNGDENDKRGQVVRIDLATGEQVVVADKLDRPTGIALLNGVLWVAARNTLVRVDPAVDTAVAPAADPTVGPDSAQTVLDNLAFNGRSNGTLGVSAEGRLIATTSGTKNDLEKSGRLWAFDPLTGALTELASGLKNGYAHVYDADGRLWITEIGDGSLDGMAYPGEINLLVEGGDYGWPMCAGLDLTDAACANTLAPLVELPAHSTPTGITVSPFAEDTLLVAQWVTGEVVAVKMGVSAEGDPFVGTVEPFISGMANPQHLITRPDGSVWVSEYSSGKIWRLSRP